MMMEAAPVAALVVAKPKFLLQLLVVPLDPPARLGHPHETLERGAPGQVGEPVLGRLGVPLRPLDQQPLLYRAEHLVSSGCGQGAAAPSVYASASARHSRR